jgi:hypothetical protein
MVAGTAVWSVRPNLGRARGEHGARQVQPLVLVVLVPHAVHLPQQVAVQQRSRAGGGVVDADIGAVGTVDTEQRLRRRVSPTPDAHTHQQLWVLPSTGT